MVIIITGASSGIGKALALKYYNKGFNVVLAARSVEKLIKIQKEFKLSNTKILIQKTDVSIKKECEKLIKKTIEKFGEIHILINNAGISMRSLFIDTDLEVIEKILQINFLGAVYCTKYALPYILKEKGSIVGISSIAGHKGLPARTGYSSSKFALQGFLESLRTEHLYDGIHVLTACPGFTSSNIRKNALGKTGQQIGESSRNENKMMTTEEVANYVYNAIKKRKNSLILTKERKLTVWLNKFFPNFLNKLIYNHLAKEHDSPLKK